MRLNGQIMKSRRVNQDPVEKATNGHLVTYKVEQKIWLNFASDYGEV